jgi:meiotic recombination protein SPO11
MQAALVVQQPGVPVYCLVDHNPHGVAILCVYKYGSCWTLGAHKAAVPVVQWLGLHTAAADDADPQGAGGMQHQHTPRQTAVLDGLVRRSVGGSPMRAELLRMRVRGRTREVESVAPQGLTAWVQAAIASNQAIA